ncbi:RING-type domain-containing protein [Durusdinium trenchii]|uniref:RING-type domain-containing protein n=1 Tax=Durusdinium trenchii TaxID=1381693 RepID=A0ABP0MJ68_9DINO
MWLFHGARLWLLFLQPSWAAGPRCHADLDDDLDPAEIFGWKGGGIQRLRFFKERLGFEARHVLDIGAHVGNWTTDALEVFPSARFLMIEANPLHRPQLEAIGQPFVIALLAAKGNESRQFHSTRYQITTGASMFRERSDLFVDPRFAETLVLRTRSLDEVVSEVFRGERCCDLLKADVQGAELTVLLGGLKTLSQAQLVLLEAPVLPYNEGAPSFSEVIAFMAAHHFELVDVADATYSEAPGLQRLPPEVRGRGAGSVELSSPSHSRPNSGLGAGLSARWGRRGPPIDARPRLRSRGLTAKLAAFAMPTPPSPPTDAAGLGEMLGATGGGATDTADVAGSDRSDPGCGFGVPWEKALLFMKTFSDFSYTPTPDAPDVTTSDSFLGFVCGDTVVAARDLRGGSGYVIGPAASSGRICVQFEQREDQSENRLNCLPDELRHTLAGGYLAGTRVRSHRTLESPAGTSIPAGCSGVVIGPARDPLFQRLLVRFALNGQDHVEELVCDPQDVESSIPGNFRRGNAVIATRDLRVNGQVVVREGVLGTVVGPSHSDSQHRVTVSFSHREDSSRNRLNCVVNEIKLYLAGNLEVGARVQAARPISYDRLAPVPTGSIGTVLGPAQDEPLARILVRWDSAPPAGAPPEREAHSDDLRLMIAGGFRRGETVLAAKDLRVKGLVVVKQNVLGTVVGQSATDPGGRVTVCFTRREDGRSNNLNVVPAEIQHMPCTGGLVPGDRVAALRQLLVVPKGAQGMVVGPSCSQSSRVAVRFHSSSAESSGECADSSEEVVLHVEPEDLKVLHAVAEDVDDALQPEREDDTEDSGPALAGGYNRGDAVAATRDLRVGGKVVVRANILGTVVGPSGQESG